MASTGQKRVLVIALDGAAPPLIHSLAARGQLPCIARLMSGGCAMPLLSTIPAITPPAWSSFATGSPPTEHGVFGFNYPDPRDYSLRLTSSRDVGRPTLWRQLSHSNRRVLLIDVPFTYPPEPVDGFLIAGFPVGESAPFTHPPDLVEQLESVDIACARHPNEAPDPATGEFAAWMDRFLGERLRLFRHLSRRQPWHFAMVGTMALDWAQHALWRYYDDRFIFAGEPEAAERREALFACHRRIDSFVGELMEVAGDDVAVIIVSDHGFGTTFHYDWIAQALEQAGLLRWRGRGKRLVGRMGLAALDAARSSARLQRWGKRLLGDTAAARAWARRARAYSQIDWSRTRVFPAGDYHLNLYVNMQGRFERGIVQGVDNYQSVLADAIAALESFRPPGHERPLIRRVARIEGGAGGLPNRVPDLSLELEVLPPKEGDARSDPVAGICGFHSPEGVLITNIAEWFGSSAPAKMEIREIAPVILRYLGVPFCGEALREATEASAFPVQEEAAVLDRLRNLGYFD